MKLANGIAPRVLGLVLCGCLTVGVGMAQRGGGGMRGGGMGGGMRGGGFGGGMGMRGGGFGGGGFGGGGFRGGGFGGGGFRGGGFGFRGGNFGFKGGFNRFGFGRFGFRNNVWPWWGVGVGFWPGWGGGWGGYPYDYGYDASYAYPANYSYPAASYPAYPAYAPSAAPAQSAPNITVIYPPQASAGSTTVIREYDEFGQEIPRGSAAAAAATGNSSSGAPIYLIALKDHTIRAVTAYWVDGPTLHIVTMDHQERQVPLDTVDRAMCEQLNRERHVQFSLGR